MAKGDIIRVGRIGFYHYGIDAGDGKAIHYNGDPYDKSNACVSEVAIKEFQKGGVVEIVKVPTDFTAEEIIERARECVGQKEYNLFFNNCEHFAKYCRTGKKPLITLRPQILDRVESNPFTNMKRNIINELTREKNVFKVIAILFKMLIKRLLPKKSTLVNIWLPILLFVVFSISLFIWMSTAIDNSSPMDDALLLTPPDPQPLRLATRSPLFTVTEDDVDLHMSYAGWNMKEKKRIPRLQIHKKAIDMIRNAKRYIVASVFLFDCMYSGTEPTFDLVSQFTDLLVNKKQTDSTITIAIVLDPVNKAYADRISSSTKRFLENGIDVFYSDLLTLRSADKTRIIETLHEIQRSDNFFSRKIIGTLASDIGNLKIPFVKMKLDNADITFETAANAALLKANHRKLLVTDKEDNFEALISSANPHNASLPSANFAISVCGETAKYIYGVIREDIRHSIMLGGDFVYWNKQADTYRDKYLDQILPFIPVSNTPDHDKPVRVSFTTENRIRQQILDMLNRAQKGDEIRIQMFYLSNFPIINDILDAAQRVETPVRLLLDPNKDAFNRIKDGTPNRQVAAYMLKEARKTKPPLTIEIRWYSTHGEQNHAKIMSITNDKNGKYEIITGSCNWTRKNLANINMESNVTVFGSKKLNKQFNDLFDRFWTNSEKDIEYSVAYDDPRFNYQKHTGFGKWSKQRRMFGIIPERNASERVIREEAVYVMW